MKHKDLRKAGTPNDNPDSVPTHANSIPNETNAFKKKNTLKNKPVQYPAQYVDAWRCAEIQKAQSSKTTISHISHTFMRTA
jgi:hypothetical protein